ncbi:hypothetical protein Amal_03952 [Acetobacter malorum]|uniref:Uncharacterized protein n=1 Tax=Acetobacter malorum TaxID=178901 RepID=A0A177G3V8_9PROT|nr:hypothetical protein Amal_03952 [Acetobacter malorum]
MAACGLAETAAAALIARFGGEDAPILNHFMRRPLKNWNGLVVGELRASRELAGDRLPDALA